MLLTFTFGLAVVPFSNAVYEKWSEIPVDLPEVESEVPVVVIIPTERNPMPFGGGSGCRKFMADFDGISEEEVKGKRKKKKYKSRSTINKKP